MNIQIRTPDTKPSETIAAPVLRVALLGTPQISRSDGTDLSARWRKELTLLSYLAVEADHAHSRESLAALLWPEASDAAARNALRVALTVLRDLLGDAPAPSIEATRTTIQFAPASAHWVDVTDFRQKIATAATHQHPAGALCDPCVAALSAAVALYRGDFLTGIPMPDSIAFEEWALMRREALHHHMLDACDSLAAYHEAHGAYDLLCQYARRQLALEPWREPAWRQLMRGLVLSGDRSAALKQYAVCQKTLADELGIEPEGETRALFERIRAGDDSASLDLQAAALHNLPAALTPFIGREADLAAIQSIRQQAGVRLLTLVGAGGMGKTRLALEVAHSQRGQYADGVYFIALAPLMDAAAIVPTIATTLGLALISTDPQHGNAGRHAVLRALRPKRMLLILDNCEHLQGGSESVVAILEAAPQVEIIATSRERLNVRGEYLYSVPGLGYAPAGSDADATQTAAARLFMQSARRVYPDFRLTAADVPALRHICAVLEGMPLGLELAAAWVEALPVIAIAAELDHSLDFLQAEWQDIPPRQRSIRAVFDWSWRLLTESEQRVFRQLAVFRGGFSRDAAREIAGATLPIVTGLVRKGLVRLNPEADASGDYAMHELLRQFAAEQLDTSGATAAVQAQHARYYLALVEHTAPELTQPDQTAALDRLDRAFDNLRAALTWMWDQRHVEMGLRLLGTLERFWFTRGYYSEGREWLERFLMSANTGAVSPDVQARALAVAGLLANTQGDYRQATHWLELGLACYQAAGDVAGAIHTLTTLGGVAYDQGDLQGAYDRWEQSLTQARALGDVGEIARALGNIGEAEYHIGDLARAEAHHTEALALARQLGRTNLEAFQLGDLGNVARRQGDLRRARTLHRQALDLKYAMGARRQIAITLEDLAAVAGAEGRGERAACLLGAASAIRERIGAPQIVPERRATEEAGAGVRTTLGEEAWAAALTRGRAFSLEHAFAYAVAELDYEEA